MVTSLESAKKKQSSAAQNCCFRRGRKKKQQLVRNLAHSSGRHILYESEVILSLLKPLQSVITQLEEDSPNLADVYRLFFNFKYEILKSIDSFFYTLSEQEEIKSIIEVREDFCKKIFQNAAYFLDFREQIRLLNDDDRVAAMEFVCELAEKLFSCKMLDVSASEISVQLKLKLKLKIQLKTNLIASVTTALDLLHQVSSVHKKNSSL